MLLLSLGGNGSGGGSQREYLGSIIPRYTEATPLITASSTSQYAQPPYSAFDGIESTNLRDPNHAWSSGNGLANQWIQYHFTEKRYFTKIVIKAFSNYSGDWVGDIKIQGSEDGAIWTNVLTTSSDTISITAKYQEMTEIEINLNEASTWDYIRILGVDALNVEGLASCFIDDIYVYGGRIISNNLITKLLTYDNNSVASKLTFTSALPLNSTITLSMLTFKNLPTNVTLGTLTRINDTKFFIAYTVDSGTTFTPPAFLSMGVSNTLFDKDYFSGTLNNENSELTTVRVEMEVEQGADLGQNKTKTNNEWAIGVWCDNIDGSIGYYGPMLIGLTTGSVDYGNNNYGTYIYENITYHYNTIRWIDGSQAKPSGCELAYSSSDLVTAGVLESSYTVPDLVKAALDFYFGA